MRFFLSLIILILFGSQVVLAQDKTSPVILEQVNYSRSFPAALRTFIPKTVKSRFWGETKLKYEHRPVWAHIYDVKKTEFPKDAVNDFGKQQCGLDLFILPGPHSLKRILTTRFSYDRYGSYRTGGVLERVGLKSLWLDPKTKKMPILQLDLMDPNGILGTVSTGIWVVAHV